MIKSINSYITKEAVISAILNFVINGGIAWMMFRNKPHLSLWGENGFGKDMLVTAMFLWLLLSVIVISTHRKKILAGKLPPLASSDFISMRRVLRWLPRTIWPASACLSLFGIVFFALPLLAVFHLHDISTLSSLSYSVFKGIWAGAMGAVATLVAIFFALFASECP